MFFSPLFETWFTHSIFYLLKPLIKQSKVALINSEVDITEVNTSDIFGSRRPLAVFERVISFLHNKKKSFIHPLVASICRKIMIRDSHLPVDVVAGDLRLRCQFNDNYSEKKYVFTPWRYDRKELSELTKALPEDGVFVDIGANVGLYTLFAAKKLTENGTILAFEPNPSTLERLKINLQANRYSYQSWPKLHVLNIGVSNKNGEEILQIDENNLGACSIAKSGQSDHVEKIHCRLLVDVLKEYDISKIDVLKIDIEGAEDVALAPFIGSADDSLLPGLIIIENSDHLWSVDLFGMLLEKGYRRIVKTRLNSVLKRE